MPDLCKLITSTFILFRSPSLLYWTAIFFNWRLFKLNRCGKWLWVIAGCHASGYRADLWATCKQQIQVENALGVHYGYRTCVCEHWTYNWIHHLSMYNWTYREGLKLWLVYGYIIYIYNNILKSWIIWPWVFLINSFSYVGFVLGT